MKIIIVGAGAAGLMTAYRLSEKGHKVTLLEAQDYLGGRICTLTIPGFNGQVESGAEFVHGKLPLTLKLLKEAGIKYTRDGGDFWNANSGKLIRGFEGNSNWHELEKALKKIETDMSLDDFLDAHLNTAELASLKIFVKNYAQGYDAADTSRMSAIAFKEEFMNDDEQHQYRIDGGYQKLIDYLATKSKEFGCEIFTSSPVEKIKWGKNGVTVVSSNNTEYTADKVILAVPAGVLQASDGKGQIQFEPAIREKIDHIEAIGYGNAMKVFFQFKSEFWKQDDYVEKYGREIKKLGFVLSSSAIPVWWTQYPLSNAMLTGWLGGPPSLNFELTTEEEILDAAIESVAHIFGAAKQEIKEQIHAWKITDWARNPYIRGAYTYPTVDAVKLGDKLISPVENIIYFAGEAFYSGPSVGTVEAALVSGNRVAETIN